MASHLPLDQTHQATIERLQAELEAERCARLQAERRADDFRRLLDQLPALVSTARGADLEYDFLNRLSQQALGDRNLIGIKAVDAFPEMVETGFYALIQQQLAQDTPWVGRAVPSPYPGENGRQHYFDVIYQPLHDAAGQVEGLLTFSYEVTDAVEARQQAEASETKYRELADAVDQLVWTLQGDGLTVEYTNARWMAYTGTAAALPSRFDWGALIHPADRPGVASQATAMMPEGVPYEFEARFKAADGTYRWFLGRMVPQKDPAGAVVRWFGTATDIHARKLLELELHEANNELEAQAEELRATNEELASQAEELSAQQEELLELYERLRRHAEVVEAEVARRTEDLQVANEELMAQAEELSAQSKALSELDRYKDEFLSVISHELRTPLNFITGFASTLADEVQGALNQAQHAAVGKILNGADRMLMLVDDILDFAKIQSGRFELSPAPTPYRPLVEEVLGLLKPLADAKGLTLDVVEMPAASPVIDGGRIAQVLTNLVGNAIKFTDAGGVTVRAWEQDGAWVTAVQDTGCGIATEHLPKLFNRFQQLDMSATRKAGGTGLGLAICKALVEVHGGTIGVESEWGRGSTFWFKLPFEAMRD